MIHKGFRGWNLPANDGLIGIMKGVVIIRGGKHIDFWDNHRTLNGYLEKQCNICLEWFDCTIDNFYKAKNKHDKLSPTCKECEKKRAKRIIEENPDKRKGYYDKYNNKPEIIQVMRKASEKQRKEGKQAEWQKNNPDKLKVYGKNHRIHDISTMEWNDCLNTFDNSCAYCGITEEEHLRIYKQRLHKEHADDEGYNDLRNAIPSCRSCNDKKWSFNMENWFRQQLFFSEYKLNKIIWWCNEGYKRYIEDKPPYRIIRKQNEGSKTYHFELWTVDEKRNYIECIRTGNKKKDIDISNL